MKFLLTLGFCLFLTLSHAQFGVRMSYGIANSGNWNDEYQKLSTTDGHFLNTSTELGADYWFRLKNVRVEFLPMLYVSLEQHLPNNQETIRTLSKGTVGFKFNTAIYPFDFTGDCDCPTFSKQGNFFTKGFFVNVAPGVSLNRLSNTKQGDEPFEYIQDRTSNVNFVIGLGAGIDIGINDLLTITPFLQYDIYPNMGWEDFNTIIASSRELSNNTTNYNKVHAGIRVGIRPDYERNKRR